MIFRIGLELIRLGLRGNFGLVVGGERKIGERVFRDLGRLFSFYDGILILVLVLLFFGR